jgi:hypothetical protein
MPFFPSLPADAGVRDILQFNRRVGRHLIEMHTALMRTDSPLTPAEHELIAAYVSLRRGRLRARSTRAARGRDQHGAGSSVDRDRAVESPPLLKRALVRGLARASDARRVADACPNADTRMSLSTRQMPHASTRRGCRVTACMPTSS